jgi:hypothetical protein
LAKQEVLSEDKRMKKLFVASLIASFLIASLLFVYLPSSEATDTAPQPEWSKTYSRGLNYSVDGFSVSAEDNGRYAIQTKDGGYAIFAELNDHHYAPHSGGIDNRTTMVIKTDSSGEVQWQKGNSIITYSYSIIQTRDSGFLLSGYQRLLKLDAEGNVQWSKNISGAFHAVQTGDGGYVLAGFVENSGTVAELLKTDESGNLLWNTTFGDSTGSSRATDVVETNDGNYAVAVYGNNAWLGEVNSNGNLILNQSFPELGGFFNSISNTKDGGLILARGTYGGGVDGQGLGLLVKFDSQRKIQWHQTYNNPPWAGYYQGRALTSVIQAGDEGYVAVGSVAFAKTDSSGNLLWAENDFDDGLGDVASVTATADGGFAFVGSMNGNVWLAKFAAESSSSSNESSPILTWLIVAVAALLAIVIVETTLLVYLKKRKR